MAGCFCVFRVCSGAGGVSCLSSVTIRAAGSVESTPTVYQVVFLLVEDVYGSIQMRFSEPLLCPGTNRRSVTIVECDGTNCYF